MRARNTGDDMPTALVMKMMKIDRIFRWAAAAPSRHDEARDKSVTQADDAMDGE
uniref:Uncharacterized protein n=1 Tax=Lotus japonicus TaxID=34305 RepID=I3S2P6_LOTJA|nr:unknown [Lotus japonicus]